MKLDHETRARQLIVLLERAIADLSNVQSRSGGRRIIDELWRALGTDDLITAVVAALQSGKNFHTQRDPKTHELISYRMLQGLPPERREEAKAEFLDAVTLLPFAGFSPKQPDREALARAVTLWSQPPGKHDKWPAVQELVASMGRRMKIPALKKAIEREMLRAGFVEEESTK